MDSYTKKSYAKVNIFLKIAGRRENYHEIVSRFVRVKNLYDTITFVPGKFDDFILEGDFGCPKEKNTIYKIYLEVISMYKNAQELFKNYKVVVEKKIPEFAGLGGGSSNAATFLLMLNDLANLGMDKKQMADIGVKIGADIPFFIYEYDSANVTGIGEIVERFDEEPLDIITFTPKVQCDTGKIFTNFRNKFYTEINDEEKEKLLKMKSFDIMGQYNIDNANDLYLSAKDIYEELEPRKYSLPKDTFFSGSGSSFFYLNKDAKENR